MTTVVNNDRICEVQAQSAAAEARYGAWLESIASAMKAGAISKEDAARLRREARAILIAETAGVYAEVRKLGTSA